MTLNGWSKVKAVKDDPIRHLWEEGAKRLLKAELRRQNITYAKLCDLLAENHIHQTERNIANKVSRGGFTAAFLLQCLFAIGSKEISLRHIEASPPGAGHGTGDKHDRGQESPSKE